MVRQVVQVLRNAQLEFLDYFDCALCAGRLLVEVALEALQRAVGFFWITTESTYAAVATWIGFAARPVSFKTLVVATSSSGATGVLRTDVDNVAILGQRRGVAALALRVVAIG